MIGFQGLASKVDLSFGQNSTLLEGLHHITHLHVVHTSGRGCKANLVLYQRQTPCVVSLIKHSSMCCVPSRKPEKRTACRVSDAPSASQRSYGMPRGRSHSRAGRPPGCAAGPAIRTTADCATTTCVQALRGHLQCRLSQRFTKQLERKIAICTLQ